MSNPHPSGNLTSSRNQVWAFFADSPHGRGHIYRARCPEPGSSEKTDKRPDDGRVIIINNKHQRIRILPAQQERLLRAWTLSRRA
jgi:hypothetical protein